MLSLLLVDLMISDRPPTPANGPTSLVKWADVSGDPNPSTAELFEGRVDLLCRGARANDDSATVPFNVPQRFPLLMSAWLMEPPLVASRLVVTNDAYEPRWPLATLVVTNNGSVPICYPFITPEVDALIADSDLDVAVVSPSGADVSMRPGFAHFSVRGGTREIAPSEESRITFLLPSWADLTELGTYTITVSRTFHFSSVGVGDFASLTKANSLGSLPIRLSATATFDFPGRDVPPEEEAETVYGVEGSNLPF